MTLTDLKEYIMSDLYRHRGRKGWPAVFKLLRKNRSFKITFWLRVAQYARTNKVPVLAQLSAWKYRQICHRYCIDFPFETQVGKGLIIYHCYGLVVNGNAIIGNNVMLAHQVTLAFENGGAPVVGDRVRIAPGAKLVGRVSVGDDALVGANTVVLTDVPVNSIAIGIPNRTIERTAPEGVERYFWPV
jgi:serine O-acetyltransferase